MRFKVQHDGCTHSAEVEVPDVLRELFLGSPDTADGRFAKFVVGHAVLPKMDRHELGEWHRWATEVST